MLCWFILKSKVNWLCVCTYIPSLLGFLPIQVTTVHLVEFPILYSMFALVIYFIHMINNVYGSTHLPVPPTTTPYFPPCYLYICSLHLCLYFCFANRVIYNSGSVGKESASNAGDQGSISGLGRSFGVRNGNSLQYSCLENSMDRVAVAESQT